MSATAHLNIEGQTRSRRKSGRTRWRALEIIAVVLGFVIWWPIGLGLLMWKLWRSKNGQPADIIDAARNIEENVMQKWPEKARRWGYSRRQAAEDNIPASWGFSTAPQSTGNAAFDEWRDAELSRLDEERRKLEESAREFAEYVDSLRKAKDREEFNQYMRQRENGQPGDPSAPKPAH